MRLLTAYVAGYGRLVDAKVNLDSKVIAVVGPNEAGKTTLLKALAYLDDDDALPARERARALPVDDDTAVVSVKYVLEDVDRGALEEHDLADAPTSLLVSKTAAGELRRDVTPRPAKNPQPARLAMKVLRMALDREGLEGLVDPDTVYGDPNSDAARDYEGELRGLLEDLQARLQGDDEAADLTLHAQAEALLGATLSTDDDDAGVRRALDVIVTWTGRPSPAIPVATALWRLSPDFLLFSEDERSLASTYELEQEVDPPPALRNLANLAGLDLSLLVRHIASGDVARRETLLHSANGRLARVFTSSWKQSRLAVRLIVEASTLRVVVLQGDDQVTVFDERSAGLRMFISLVAFLGVQGGNRPPVLLIDEAETHLHIDAQADLVQMFVQQQRAVKVIYTTHSPACLPPDLGSGIRSVVPSADDALVSVIKNNFWQGAAGYTPLMLAMGAAAAAFTPARMVVLAEGATEMLLLPSLIRAAVGLDDLPYQIAPGLSEAPSDLYAELDLEASRVAYLVDSDPGGDALKRGLIKAGVPEGRVLTLAGPGIENLLVPEDYSEAVVALLAERNGRVPQQPAPTLSATGAEPWATIVETWIRDAGLAAPSKVAVANWLVGHGSVLPNDNAKHHLRALHAQILDVLT